MTSSAPNTSMFSDVTTMLAANVTSVIRDVTNDTAVTGSGGGQVTPGVDTGGGDKGPVVTAYDLNVNSQIIKNIYTPLLIIVGYIGNTFTIMVMRRKSMRKSATCFYICCLAIADIVALTFGLMPIFLQTLTGGSLNPRYWADCKLSDWLMYSTTDISIWLVIAMTVDRYIATCHPVQAMIVSNTKVALRVVLTVAAAMLLINMHMCFTLTFEHDVDKGVKDCTVVEWSQNFSQFTWPWIDFCVYTAFPAILVMSFNAIIIVTMIKRQKALVRGKDDQFKKQTQKMTQTLLVVSFTMICTTTPITIMQIAQEYSRGSDDPSVFAAWDLATTLGDMLMYVNHSINFFLYCITGARFRLELRSLLHCPVPRIGEAETGTRTTTVHDDDEHDEHDDHEKW